MFNLMFELFQHSFLSRAPCWNLHNANILRCEKHPMQSNTHLYKHLQGTR
jgi:hypothetical protein